MITRTVATVVATPATELQSAVEDFATELATDLLPLLVASAQVDDTSVSEAREQFLSTLRDALALQQHSSEPVDEPKWMTFHNTVTGAEARWEDRTQRSNA